MTRSIRKRRSSSAIALVVVVAWAAAALPALAQAPAPNAGKIALTGNIDVRNAYFLRGLPQDDSRVILWPSIDAGIAVSSNVTVNVGLWNSLHTGVQGLDGPSGKLWYQSNFYGSVTVGGRGLTLGAVYTGFTSPNNAFASVQEIAFRASHDSWARPYALVAVELKGQMDQGRNKGRYLELGGAPSWGSGLVLAVPVSVGVSLGDYYETFIGDEKFGFFTVGGTLTKTMANGSYGRWNVHGGAEYILLGERNKIVFGADSKVIGSVGIGFSY
jgi:hypothetical protein